MPDDFTDPAEELAGMAQWLTDLPSGGSSPTYTHLCANLSIDPGSSDYLILLAEARLRLDRIRQFAKNLNDEAFEERRRLQVLTAAERLAGFFNPHQQTLSFESARTNFVKPEDIVSLLWFSKVAQRHRPLRRLSDAERKNAITEIDHVVAKIVDDKTLPIWAVPILTDGLMRVRLTLLHLTFFGHDAALESVLNLDRQTHGVIEFLKMKGQTVTESILEIAKTIALCVTLFNAPMNVSHAYLEYKGIVTKVLSHHPNLLALPPPDASGNAKPDEEADFYGSTDA